MPVRTAEGAEAAESREGRPQLGGGPNGGRCSWPDTEPESSEAVHLLGDNRGGVSRVARGSGLESYAAALIA